MTSNAPHLPRARRETPAVTLALHPLAGFDPGTRLRERIEGDSRDSRVHPLIPGQQSP
jgi:hypothetical protein